MAKVSKIMSPETLALSSTTVESARKDVKQGYPNPNDIPSSTLENRVKTVPGYTAKEAVATTPKVVDDHRSLLRLTLQLIELAIIAEKAPKLRNKAFPT
jgi:hypothetical protein